MKVVVLRTMPHDGKMLKPGEPLDLPEAEAKSLIARGKVVAADQVRNGEGAGRADRKR